MFRLIYFFLIIVVLFAKPLPPALALEDDDNKNSLSYKGWDHLAQKLLLDGIPHQDILTLINRKNFPHFQNVQFSLNPKENLTTYEIFLKPKRLEVAKNCLQENLNSLIQAEKNFSVDKYVLVSIFYVETLCGKITGNTNIIERLVRLANIDDPNNIEQNYQRLAKTDSNITREAVIARANTVAQMFYPEILALYEIAKKSPTNIYTLKGSYAGAFGYTQFLPSSFLKFGVDGNADGEISLFNAADAIASTANFLSSYGWKNDLTLDEKKQTIWKYNHSDAYVSTILQIAEILRES